MARRQLGHGIPEMSSPKHPVSWACPRLLAKPGFNPQELSARLLEGPLFAFSTAAITNYNPCRGLTHKCVAFEF